MFNLDDSTSFRIECINQQLNKVQRGALRRLASDTYVHLWQTPDRLMDAGCPPYAVGVKGKHHTITGLTEEDLALLLDAGLIQTFPLRRPGHLRFELTSLGTQLGIAYQVEAELTNQYEKV